MLTTSISKLLAISSPALGEKAPADGYLESAINISELHSLLTLRNGFYAFESALWVLPSRSTKGIDLSTWNDPNGWRREYANLADGIFFFAQDIFGNQFGMYNDKIITFDAETAEIRTISGSLEDWAAEILEDYAILTGHPVANAWQKLHGSLPANCRLLPSRPLILGGGFEVSNFTAQLATDAMVARGHLAIQIHDLPDGTEIELM